MGRSAFISAALHIAILLWLVVVIDSGPLDGEPIREIPVEIVSPSELTKIKAGTQDATSDKPLAPTPQEEKPLALNEKSEPEEATPPPPAPAEETPPVEEAPPEEPVEEAPPPAPDPEEAPPPPEPEEAEAPAEAPEEVADNRPPPSAPLRKPPPPPPSQTAETPSRSNRPAPDTQSDSNTDRLAALLDKMPDGGEEPQIDDMPMEDTVEEAHGQTNGTEMTMSVNEIDALRSRIAQCWNPPPGGLGAAQIVIKLRMQLNEDGTLVGYPTVENSGSSPFFRAAAEAAVRAVYQCQPYQLPVAKYSLWRDMILNFDPSDMYRAG